MSFSGLLGSAVLFGWVDAPAIEETTLNDWYTYEHMAERMALPGFRRARRFVATDRRPERPKWCALYEVDRVERLNSGPYLDLLDEPTPVTVAMLRQLSYVRRLACAVTVSAGVGTAGNVATCEIQVATSREDELRGWLADTAFPMFVAERHVMAIYAFEGSPAVTAARDRTQEGRQTRDVRDNSGNWFIFAELSDEHRADEIEAGLRSGLRAYSEPGSDTEFRTFRLVTELVQNER